MIKETTTFFLLNIPSTCFSSEDPSVEALKLKNEKYLEVNNFVHFQQFQLIIIYF